MHLHTYLYTHIHTCLQAHIKNNSYKCITNTKVLTYANTEYTHIYLYSYRSFERIKRNIMMHRFPCFSILITRHIIRHIIITSISSIVLLLLLCEYFFVCQ